MKISRLLLPILFFFAVSCNSTSEIDTIAGELCDCLRPMIEMYNTLGDGTDSEALEGAIEELGRLAEESQSCADDMTDRYGDLAARQQEVDEAMARVCPDIVQRLNEFQ